MYIVYVSHPRIVSEDLTTKTVLRRKQCSYFFRLQIYRKSYRFLHLFLVDLLRENLTKLVFIGQKMAEHGLCVIK